MNTSTPVDFELEMELFQKKFDSSVTFTDLFLTCCIQKCLKNIIRRKKNMAMYRISPLLISFTD